MSEVSRLRGHTKARSYSDLNFNQHWNNRVRLERGVQMYKSFIAVCRLSGISDLEDTLRTGSACWDMLKR